MVFGNSPSDIEFGQKCLVLLKAKNPFLSKEAKHKILRGFVDSLSQQTFLVYADKILDFVNFDNGKDYKTTEEQVNHVISWCPRFEDIKVELTKRVKETRAKHKLPI